MNVLVTNEHRFDRTPDGAVWTKNVFAYPFWTRYLETFDHCSVLARVREVGRPPEGASRADGSEVSFTGLPHYVGPREYLAHVGAIRRIAREAASRDQALILRVPSIIASHAERVRDERKGPYGVEVVGNPLDTFGRRAIHHPLRPLFRLWFGRRLRLQCQRAAATAYVTAEALQRVFPPESGSFSTSYTDVEIESRLLRDRPRSFEQWDRIGSLLSVASLEHAYKGIDVLIDAVRLLRDRGVRVECVVAGDGRRRGALEARARRSGVESLMRFPGWLPSGAPIRELMDKADLFVLPSRTEGLPRALLEAMARALPCIASSVGGIPELLDTEDLVQPNQPTALAERIATVLRSAKRLTAMSARNLRAAGRYTEEAIGPRRREFYGNLKSLTREWLSHR